MVEKLSLDSFEELCERAMGRGSLTETKERMQMKRSAHRRNRGNALSDSLADASADVLLYALADVATDVTLDITVGETHVR